MFAVMQKGTELKPCYSDSDYKYLQARGWSKVQDKPIEPVIEKQKRRYTLRLKKPCQSPLTQS